MRWKAKPVPPDRREGDKRTVRRFALFPRRVEDDMDEDVVVWLEWYWCQQEWQWDIYSARWQTVGRYADDALLSRPLGERRPSGGGKADG